MTRVLTYVSGAVLLALCGLVSLEAGASSQSQAQSQTPQPQAPAVGTPTLPVTALAALDLPRIGYDAFKVDMSTIESGPVDGQYMLSPGDTVHVRVWGELQLTFQVVVSEDLHLEIPDVPGRVYVADLPLTEVKDRVRRHLATQYDTFFNLDNPAASAAFVDLTLGEVRDLRFLVQGEVVTPGSYSLHPSLSNLIYALAKAGGVKHSGSLRTIRVRRGNQNLNVDFYEFLMQGTVDDSKLRLRNGDVIFVPLKRKEVTIQGEVRRPGIYALHETTAEDLDKLLDFAGGALATAATDRLLIRRTEPNIGQRTLSINLNAERAAGRRVVLQDADVVTLVPTNTVRRDFVTLRGHGIPVPGEYQFKPGTRVNELLAAAGGLMPDAYLERADLRRMGADMRSSFTQINLRLAAQADPAHNIIVEALDDIVVYSVRDIEGGDGTVILRGHVKSAGEVPLARGMRLYDLLFARAGLQDSDFMRDTYLPRADVIRIVPGSTRTELITFDLGKLLGGDASQNLELRADDEIVIYDRGAVLGAARTVTLSGHAKVPGNHPLLQGMRVLDLLRTAGGFEDPDFRREAYLPRADVWRRRGLGDRVERELMRVDLAAALRGDQTQNLLLESGDEVVVYAARNFAEARTVEVAGAVNKPGTFELASNMTLGDLLIQAGGLKDMADTETAELFRVVLDGATQVALESVSVRLADTTFALRNRDRLLVRMRGGYQPSRVVEVTGQVQYPGSYTLDAGGRVADVIRMAGGLVDGAFLDGAALRRGPDGTRIVFDLDRAMSQASSSDNLLLEHGDRLTVPRRTNTVTVVDAVERPITIAFAPGKGVEYYLQAAGGPTADADPNGAAVILPSGRYAPSRFLRGPEVLPGSTIVVPSKPPVAAAPANPVTPDPVAQTPAPAPSASAPPELLRTSPTSPTTANGPLGEVTGPCPAASFSLGSVRLATTADTVFIGVTCADLKAGLRVAVTFLPQTDRAVAIEIRRQ
jgi:polysaccharide biosynthesis/export protein